MNYRGRLFILTSLVSSLALGWGSDGHIITARIAEYYFTPTTAKKLRAILAKELAPRTFEPREKTEKPLATAPQSTLVDQAHTTHSHPPLPPESQAVKMPPIIGVNWISSWADHLRPQKDRPNAQDVLWPLTRLWHYLNLPIEAPKMEVDSYCKNDDCIIRRLQSLTTALQSGSQTYPIGDTYEAPENEMVKFLVHFFGDLNQPLHICENDKDQDGHAVAGQDKGGNSRKVNFFGETTIKYPDGSHALSLHSIWDDKMIERLMMTDRKTGRHARRVYALSEELFKRITAKQKAEWSVGSAVPKVNYEKWAWESHELAANVAYEDVNLDFSATSVISEEYYDRATKVIEQQLQKGGYTLGMVLNQIYDPNFKL